MALDGFSSCMSLGNELERIRDEAWHGDLLITNRSIESDCSLFTVTVTDMFLLKS